MERILSQQEIDSAFRNTRDSIAEPSVPEVGESYDFRRTDRIAKDQLRMIHMLHDNFARSMASSLSAYLRSYVMVNLISVEQLSFNEFTHSLPSPTTVITMAMKPYEGNAVLEMNPALVFPLIEMLLGGSGRQPTSLNRETTEIEQSILDGLVRVILRDLEAAWTAIAPMQFTIENHETDATLLQVVAQNEAVVAISLEVCIGEVVGMMNIGIPSIVLKMLRQKFDNHRTVRKSQSTEEESSRMLRLIEPSLLHVDARLQGPTLDVSTLVDLQEGDVLVFDYPAGRPLDLMINGKIKFEGAVVANGAKRAFSIQRLT